MKYFNLFLILFFAMNSWAVTVEIRDPCKDQTLAAQVAATNFSERPSVGLLTIQLLNDKKIPFQGSEAGIGSIFNTPQSDASIDIVSDTELFAYGWCYHLNGEEPGEMPDQVYLKSDNDHIVWFYAYSHYLSGKWVSMCTPAFTRPLQNYCKLKQIKP